jgi:hypothetical protein
MNIGFGENGQVLTAVNGEPGWIDLSEDEQQLFEFARNNWNTRDWIRLGSLSHMGPPGVYTSVLVSMGWKKR